MRRRHIQYTVLAAIVPIVAACSLGLTDVPDPSTIVDPSVVQTQAGAVSLYSQALTLFDGIYAGGNASVAGNSFVLASGLASDEFSTGAPSEAAYALRRVGPGGLPTPGSSVGAAEQPYGGMHTARLMIDQAIGALKEYGKTSPSSYVAQLYALRGYLSTMFAEMFCSGVPFSRAVYGGDIVLGTPLSTTEMLEQATADFDSALAISADSMRIRRLAYVGKARALLDLGQFTEAAALVSVANVPTNFVYAAEFNAQSFTNYVAAGTSTDYFAQPDFQVANRLGSNGLDYLEAGTAGDPRLSTYNSAGFSPVPYPGRFPTNDTPVPLADGVEARLIQAEAALQTNDVTTWENILDTLRQTASTAPIPALSTDSTSGATQTLRENVMFRERAFWLYGTGHRLGDLRRLVRQYNRPMSAVFPVGKHPNLSAPNNVFSSYPNFAPPIAESNNNPNYKGCLNRDA